MSIIKLAKVRSGDVLLENGAAKIAGSGGQGPFGHASLAITRLVWLQVGLDGVDVATRELGQYQDAAPFLGFEVAGDAQLRRLLTPPKFVDVWAQGFAEVGRAYASRAKLRKTTDLTPVGDRLLRAPNEHLREQDDLLTPGRSCSEAAAVVLGLSVTLISPNGLATTPALKTVADAVATNAAFVGPHPRQGELNALVDAMERTAVVDFAAGLSALAQRTPSGARPPEEEVEALQARLTTALEKNSELTRQIEAIEREILAPGAASPGQGQP